MSEELRIGVYVCHCGTNIAGVVNVKDVVEYAKTLPNVVVAKEYVFMCSAPGQQIIKEDIKNFKLNRVVVAACSPSLHEPTFRTATAEGGLNPYLFEMANIREHCSWVHPDEKEVATTKAKLLVKMAVAKASLLEPLSEIKFKVNNTALIIGGGVSGLAAARDLAARGIKTYLIDRSPTLGGRAARLGKLTYTEMKGIDVFKGLIRDVAGNRLIDVYTNTELVSVDGSVGNFKVKLVKNPRYVDAKCNLCGECAKVCPVEVPDEFEFGMSKRKAIYLPFKDAYPRIYVIDMKSCTRCLECVKVCPVGAINLNEKPSELTINVGGIIVAAGYDPYEPKTGEYGYKLSNKVITLFQLERLLDSEGPTKGELIVNGVKPKNIVFVMCVGSLSTTPDAYPYCSRMCCSSTIKNALVLREKYPDTNIYIAYKDVRTYGRGDEQLYMKAGENFVRFAKFKDAPKINIDQKGNLSVTLFEETLQEEITIPTDLVVLVVGMTPPRDIDKVRTTIKIGCGPEGFLREAHLKLRPVETATDGVYLAGAVTGPKNIIESIASGSAAASRTLALLSKEEVAVEPLIAVVNEDICSGCAICVAMCPYGAISLKIIDKNIRVAKVDSALCKGCGTCAAACPSGAMQQYGFKDAQIKAQVIAAMGEV
ncbi:MAG: CoB--CoM heterodisulfide reductase iron-sulfur subunit A family protein [Archaeoglobaceae archaeon]|nr:CoB--CoM heterodisulfide reductase iron-sulfur subunit A family protein [Archaeoglobaceae archaeon]MDW7990218.1 CoB--CoM heterodisulfide reductase iron-sulfur subunit A family protein [Archaeoglobaceae archaeon]